MGVVLFLLGEVCGMVISAILFGWLDRFIEWRKKRKSRCRGNVCG